MTREGEAAWQEILRWIGDPRRRLWVDAWRLHAAGDEEILAAFEAWQATIVEAGAAFKHNHAVRKIEDPSFFELEEARGREYLAYIATFVAEDHVLAIVARRHREAMLQHHEQGKERQGPSPRDPDPQDEE
jgi:hypothetical protein